MRGMSDVPILRATEGLEGWWQFLPTEERGAAIIVVRFRRGGRADIICRYGAVFIFDLLDGLVARGDVAAATDGARAAVRALELKHAARRDAEARESLEFPSAGVPRSAPAVAAEPPPAVAPAGADLPPAGGPIPGAAP